MGLSQVICVKAHNKISKNISSDWAPAGVAQWIKHWPANQRVAGSIPSQGTCLGYEGVREATTQ